MGNMPILQPMESMTGTVAFTSHTAYELYRRFNSSQSSNIKNTKLATKLSRRFRYFAAMGQSISLFLFLCPQKTFSIHTKQKVLF